MPTPPSYTPRLISSAGNDDTQETKYRSLAGPSYELKVSANNAGTKNGDYKPKTVSGGYSFGPAGYAYFRKRRPRRPFFGKGCSYCGGSFNDKPLVATAVNSTGRLVDTKRLSVPHCDGCGKRAA